MMKPLKPRLILTFSLALSGCNFSNHDKQEEFNINCESKRYIAKLKAPPSGMGKIIIKDKNLKSSPLNKKQEVMYLRSYFNNQEAADYMNEFCRTQSIKSPAHVIMKGKTPNRFIRASKDGLRYAEMYDGQQRYLSIKDNKAKSILTIHNSSGESSKIVNNIHNYAADGAIPALGPNHKKNTSVESDNDITLYPRKNGTEKTLDQ